MSNIVPLQTDVLVVGAGPVGLALAGDLGWRRHGCLVVDKGDGSVVQAKMDLVGIRTMEFCRRWGIVGDVEASPYNRDYPQDNVYLTSLNGFELGRQVMPSMREDRPPPESPQKRERCPQNMFDPILQKFAKSQPAVQLLYGHQFLSFEQDDHGVITKVLDLTSSREIAVRSRYLVGCDGARSVVREQLGIAMHGKGVLSHTTNVIFKCPNFNALHDKTPGYRYMFVGSEGTWGTIVAINGTDQWRMSIIGNALERRRYDERELKALAYKALGREFDLEILSALFWTRSELVAEQYRDRRVFICGDACHLTSPTGGLGMNTGIGDAVDLSWKLSANLDQWGGENLLQSYEIERRPVAKRVTRFSTGNLRIMRDVPSSEKILHAGSEGAEARAIVGRALGEGLKREWFSLNMHLGNRYVDSPVCIYTEPEPRKLIRAEYEDAVNYRPTSRPGCRAPHVWLPDGRSTLDLFGVGFVLLVLGASAEEAGAFEAAAASISAPLNIVCVNDPEAIATYEKRYVLVRPDGHVAWRSDSMPDNPAPILETITGTRNAAVAGRKSSPSTCTCL